MKNSKYIGTFFFCSPQVDVCELYALFRCFGEIRNILQRSENFFGIEYVFIADERLNREHGKIFIDGRKFLFQFGGFRVLQNVLNHVNDENRVNDEWIMAPVEDSPQNIINALNDDCLLHIFTELSVRDLYTVANVCQRFESIAKHAFRIKYSQQGRSPMTDLYEGGIITLFQIELFLQTFGTEIRTFSVSKYKEKLNIDILLRMCVEWCPKIEVLSLAADWSACLKKSMSGLMPRLKKLTFDVYHFNGQYSMGDLFVGDWPLEKLEFIGLPDWETTTIRMPKLTDLHLTAHSDHLTVKHVKQILSRNAQIRTVRLTDMKTNQPMLQMNFNGVMEPCFSL